MVATQTQWGPDSDSLVRVVIVAVGTGPGDSDVDGGRPCAGALGANARAVRVWLRVWLGVIFPVEGRRQLWC